MQAPVVAAVVAGCVAAIGWFATYLVNLRVEGKKQSRAAHLAYVERQLSELYGPLSFLVREGQASFQDLLRTLGRPRVFTRDAEIPEGELKVWLFWVDNDLMPRNQAVQNLLSSKAHLIDSSSLPESHAAFVGHYNSWRVSHLRWTVEGVAYSWHSTVDFPHQFQTDVLETFSRLKQKHAKLIGLVLGDEQSEVDTDFRPKAPTANI